jgi:hypothetical protein
MTTPFQTPKTLLECIILSMNQNYKKPEKELAPLLANDVKDFAAQRFQVAIIRAEKNGNNNEARNFQALFETVFGVPGADARKLIPMWVIYVNPSDHPGKTIARLWTEQGPTGQIIEGALDDLRVRFESQGLVNIGRNVQDDPCISEVWL